MRNWKILLLLSVLLPWTAAALDNDDCFGCHEDKALVKTNAAGKAVSLFVDKAAFTNSIHAKHLCVSCHADIKDVPHPDAFVAKAVSCAACHRVETQIYTGSDHGIAVHKGVQEAASCKDCHGNNHYLLSYRNPASKLNWKNVPATCGKCHENVNQTYLRSVHGQAVKSGVRDAPVCTDCHGEHTIVSVKSPGSRVSSGNIPGTCGQCHASQRIVTQYRLPPNVSATYAESFHGLDLKGGSAMAANCASCHGVHDILPSGDTRSSINPQNLPRTCGKCHPGIGTRMSADFFRVHAPPGAAEGKPWVVNFVSWGYIALIILVIGGMAGFVALDYLRKAREHIRAVAKGDGELRMTAGMRLQHHVLVVLFVLLAYTGLVHKSPDAFWSWPFHVMPNGSLIRSQIHHYCGWAFTIFFLIHLIALFGTRKGRVHAKALLPVWSDATDALAVFAHNIGLRKTPPPPRRWNYAEKAEYWALVWGSVVMAVTGAMLIFTETVLRLLPKVWHDVAQVIHYYEAVLAILAILVWHLYWVIFDPHEYPMNPSWLTGKKAPHPPHTPNPPPA